MNRRIPDPPPHLRDDCYCDQRRGFPLIAVAMAAMIALALFGLLGACA